MVLCVTSLISKWKSRALRVLSCWTQINSAFANSVDPDQLSYEEANWSGSALFVFKYLSLYEQLGSSIPIGWKLKAGVAS